MSTSTDRDVQTPLGVTVSFGERFAASDQFDAIFKEGMGLVERTAAYLDGQGRKEARALRGPVAVLYATESMRLTTRLLELASWLMIRRALKEGEITQAEARTKRERVKLRAPGRPAHVKGYAELPQGLRTLIDTSYALNDRIFQLDRAIEGGIEEAARLGNPVGAQVTRLEEAFSQPQRRAAVRGFLGRGA
jgi:regulator of CtrA degradation